MGRRLTKEEFISKARDVHGNKYNYEKAVYNGSNEKIIITCPKHGDFEQVANSHLHGHGCDKCAKESQISGKDKFIAEARVVHGNKYNYDKVEYKRCDIPVTVICPIHGEFPVRPRDHKHGSGCSKCVIEKRKLTLDEIIRQFVEIHSNKYDYSKVEYVNDGTHIIVTCPKHGDFPVTPNNHKKGKGCPYCSGRGHRTQEWTINKFREVHGDKYDYSKVEYIKDSLPVIIICPEHGEFKQTPNNHKHGEGCPWCKTSHMERSVRLLLAENGIKYFPQHTFDWLKYKRNMYLDFYLPEYNIAIECQGIQHYKSNAHFKEEDVASTKVRDKLKYKLCKDNGIPIYYIRYDYNIKESINNLLNNIINKDANTK